MLTSEVLNTAADLIEKRGWTTMLGLGSDEAVEAWFPKPTSTGPLCLEGGINGACQDEKRLARASIDILAEYLDWTRPLFAWNDRTGRTAAEVIEVLRACALIESAREQDSAWQTYATNVARVTV